MGNIWKIKFFKNSYQLNDDYERLSEFEKEQVSTLYVECYIDWDDDFDHYNCILLTDLDSIKMYQKILNSNFIKYSIEDISNKVINSEINIFDEVKTISNPIKFKSFNDIITKWISERLDIDIVLDRISKVGIGGLKDYEKEFLKHYKH
jgi:hypothetical protein